MLLRNTQQQQILYSGVYLQLYNLTESTVTKCIEAIWSAIENNWKLADLSDKMRREWVRSKARTHTELNEDRRLDAVLALCEYIIQELPVSKIETEKAGGGNWDDVAIYKICERLGWPLVITDKANSAVKRRVRNDKGALVLVKDFRNELAHGSLSFAECSAGTTVSDLDDLKNCIVIYLREVVAFFQSSINSHKFLLQERRPA